MLEIWKSHTWFNLELKNSVEAFIDETKETSNSILNNSKYSPEALALINKYWWKTVSILWQYMNWNSKFLMPFNVLCVKNANNYNLNKWYDEFFRASSSWDENGLIWVLKSIKSWIEGWKIIKSAEIVEEIIKHWNSNLIRQYAEQYDWNKDYRWIDSILISPNIEKEFGDYTFGSITKHSDFENIYIINIDWWRAQCLVDPKWKIHKIIWFHDRLDTIKDNLKEIIQMKLVTDSVWFVNWVTTQTEFAIISDKQKDRINKLSENYEFSSKLNSNIVFLQQREFRKESKEKINQYALDECFWALYNYNMFWDQNVFRRGYKKFSLANFYFSFDNISKDEKVIIKINMVNYDLLFKNSKFFWILRDSRIAWIEIDINQSQWLWSIEHDTYRIINNDIPIKVISWTVTRDDA